jgi:hypothetical protein
MYKSKQKISFEKKITDGYCADNSIWDIIEVLKTDQRNHLWDKYKDKWTIPEWEEFFKLQEIANK